MNELFVAKEVGVPPAAPQASLEASPPEIEREPQNSSPRPEKRSTRKRAAPTKSLSLQLSDEEDSQDDYDDDGSISLEE